MSGIDELQVLEGLDPQPFHAALEDGRLLVPQCRECRQFHWYPRATCPFCSGVAIWEAVSGRGTIHSFTTLRTASPPYTIAYVELDEGPIVLTNLTGTEHGFDIGVAVEMQPLRPDGQAIPCFAPVTS